MTGKGDRESGSHTTGDYSGTVQEANVGVKGKASDMAIVFSSGKSAQEDRKARREAKKGKKDKK